MQNGRRDRTLQNNTIVSRLKAYSLHELIIFICIHHVIGPWRWSNVIKKLVGYNKRKPLAPDLGDQLGQLHTTGLAFQWSRTPMSRSRAGMDL